ncbi:unnamed protein product [Phytophthora fragariaefolia]|uniref:Unnamed protein product n=1 Tax=Phytophthora fragariaefolia TaxID=1490495 RepID=A0A9W6TUF3_9STRA|nr:unnamed protein product [Phytophthora fragariaefolia]
MADCRQQKEQQRLATELCDVAEPSNEEVRVAEGTNEAQEREARLARPPLRQTIAAVDDIMLLKAVNSYRPWPAAVGTSKGIMKVFEDIAIHRLLDESFGMKNSGTAMRTRFTNLENIVTLVNDWDDKEAQREKEQTAKQKGTERSGELLRQLAMGEIASEENDNRFEGDISE